MITANNLRVLAPGGRCLLDDVSLSVAAGEVVCVVGPNGAGKSTLLRCLAGELRPQAGTVALAGTRLPDWHARDLARRRAVVSQSVELVFPLSAAEVVALGRLPWGSASEDAAVVGDAMARAGVAHLARHAYATLSGGERQRVQLARALAQLDGAESPAALLLDEPTASLDAGHRGALLRILRDLAAGGTAVLVVLHDLIEAAIVSDRVALLEGGRLVALGPPETVLRADRLGAVYGMAFRDLPGGGLVPDYGDIRAARVAPP